MSILTKIVAASDLPVDWQRELSIDGARKVRIEITEVEEDGASTDRERLLTELKSLNPVSIKGDATTFIRAERERLDGRNQAWK